jgi:hypothetical protein
MIEGRMVSEKKRRGEIKKSWRKKGNERMEKEEREK